MGQGASSRPGDVIQEVGWISAPTSWSRAHASCAMLVGPYAARDARFEIMNVDFRRARAPVPGTLLPLCLKNSFRTHHACFFGYECIVRSGLKASLLPGPVAKLRSRHSDTW